MKERRVPPFYQIPILLIAALFGVATFGIGIWEQTSSDVAWWVTGVPFAGAGAACTLIVADVIKHQHLSGSHVKALALAMLPLVAGLFAWTLGFAIFAVVVAVVLSIMSAAT